jgi:hypothetical protein
VPGIVQLVYFVAVAGFQEYSLHVLEIVGTLGMVRPWVRVISDNTVALSFSIVDEGLFEADARKCLFVLDRVIASRERSRLVDRIVSVQPSQSCHPGAIFCVAVEDAFVDGASRCSSCAVHDPVGSGTRAATTDAAPFR